MTYKALFLDIDGTILKPDHTYTQSTKEAIQQVQEQGLKVFLATGRPAHELYDLAEELQVPSIIGYNGAYAIHNNEVLFNKPLQQETVHQLTKITAQQANEMVLYSREYNLFTSIEDSSSQEFIDLFQLKQNKQYDKQINDSIYSITLMNMDDTDPNLFKLDSDIELAPVHLDGVEHCYDVIRKSVNKGEAIKAVLTHLNISPKEAIAFGDGMNDKEMLQTVERGFAMENANPDLFQFASDKTTSVEHSGIYNGLKKLGLV